jgi:hypothetical protein
MLPIILTIVFMSTNYETAVSFYHMLRRKLSDFMMYFLDETFLKLNFPLTSWTGKYFYTLDTVLCHHSTLACFSGAPKCM